MSVKLVLNVAKTIVFLVLEAPIRPRWAYYRLRSFYYNHYKNRFHTVRIGEYQKRLQPLYDAVAFITDHSLDEVRAAEHSEILQNMQVEKGPDSWVVDLPGAGEPAAAHSKGPIKTFYGPSPEQLKAVHMVCRLMRPKVVIETGVAKGFTSAVILDALKSNETGDLYSVEMPSLYLGYRQQVGEKIPMSLRARWHLELGPSALVLPRLLERLGTVDVFVYDSAASYDNQITEFGIILTCMRPGGVLISNFMKTDALIEIAATHNCKWTTTEQTKPYPLGLLTKPG